MCNRISSASYCNTTHDSFFISNPFRSPVIVPTTRLYRYKQGHIRASSESPQLSRKVMNPAVKCNLIVSPHIGQHSYISSPKVLNKKPVIRMMIQKMLHQRDPKPKTKFPLSPVIGNSLSGMPSFHKFPLYTRCRKKLIPPLHKFLYRTYDKMYNFSLSKQMLNKSGRISTQNKSIIVPMKVEGCSCWESEKEDACFSNGALNVN